jgi:hypothetical protein
MTARPDTSAAASRRAFLAGAAAAVATPTALAVLGAASPASASAATGCPPPSYAPVPPSALGPALNADGYFAGPITDTLYWVTDSFYQAMFLTTRADGLTQIQYIADLQASTQAAIASIDPTPFFHQYAPNAWAIFKAYLDAVSTQAAGPVTAKYTGVLAAADVYTFLNAAAMLDSLRVDTGDLGPFGDHP